jgi:Tol biopolymer transport system component
MMRKLWAAGVIVCVIVVCGLANAASWTQTTQQDFEAGVGTNVDTSSSPGDVKLAASVTSGTIASDVFDSGANGSGWTALSWSETNIIASSELSADANTVGLWHLNDGSGTTTADSSGNGYTGTLYGATWVDGKFGKALSFNGVNNSVVLPDNVANLSVGTVEMWIYPTLLDGTAKIFWTGGDSSWAIEISTANKIVGYARNANGTGVVTDSNFAVTPNNWYHVAMSWDGVTEKKVNLYINGELKATNTLVGINNPGASGWTRLGIYGNGNYPFKGTIDEVRISNVARTTTEIKADYGITTDITFKVRTSDTAFAKDASTPAWIYVGGTSPTSLYVSGRYFQWQATLTTNDTSQTPVLHDVNAVYSVQTPPWTCNGTLTNEGVARLTTNQYRDELPSWSPDGTKIAYTSQSTSSISSINVWVMNADGSNKVQLTSSGYNLAPSWSPDGTKIAFLSQRSGNYDIWVMNADGSNQVQLTTSPLWEANPHWSPDGTKIAFDTSVNNYDTHYAIWLMNADGSNRVQLTDSTAANDWPVWSPDGTKILFQSTRAGNFDIWVMNADGSNPVQLTTEPSTDQMPVWSPDGAKIAFESDRSDVSDIWVMNADGSNQVRLTTEPSIDQIPNWKKDGTQIAFTTNRYGASNDIAVITLGCSAPTQDTTPPASVTNLVNTTYASSYINWTWTNPADADFSHVMVYIDGVWRAKVSTNYYTATGFMPETTHTISTLTVDASGNINPTWVNNTAMTAPAAPVFTCSGTYTNEGVTRLTTNQYRDELPSWSPDGTKIAYTSQSTSSLSSINIWVMNADGSSKVQLTSSGYNIGPLWSPDGTKIAFTSMRSGNYDIWVMNADGSNQVQLTTSPLWEANPHWSPDGSKIAFDASANKYDIYYAIWLMNADGSNRVQLTDSTAANDWPVWSPDGTKILFQSTRAGNFDIWVMNADGSNPVQLTTEPSTDQMPVWSPDGAKIAFESDRSDVSDIWVMNADGSNQVRLTTEPSIDQIPNWKKDGTQIAFTTNRYGASNDIAVITLGCSAPTQDTTPPASVTNLVNTTYASSYINWTWTNPADADFSHVMVYIDGVWRAKVSTNYYTATGFMPETTHTISTLTVDASGNINPTWVNNTAMTAPAPPSSSIGWIEATSNPSNASITLDGVPAGETPTQILSVTVGKHTVRMSKVGYDECTKEVNVIADRANPVHCNFNVKINPHKDGSDVVLTLDDTGDVLSYQIHETTDRFSWNFSQYQETASNSSRTTGAAPEQPIKYYLVRALNQSMGEYKSKIVAEVSKTFSYNPSKTNVNWISVPYDCNFKKASDIVAAIEPSSTNTKISGIAKWDAKTQTSMGYGYVAGPGWIGTDFDINPGDGVYISLSGNSQSFDWDIIGKDSEPVKTFSYNPSKTNVNWLSIPYTGTYKKASDIVAAIEPSSTNTKISGIAKWDAKTQTSMGYGYVAGPGWIGTDFDINPGDGIYISLSGNTPSFDWTVDLVPV